MPIQEKDKTAFEIPRRRNIDRQTPAERAIRDAMSAVEAMAPHPHLTAAVCLLEQALERVADFVDCEPVREPDQEVQRPGAAKPLALGPGGTLLKCLNEWKDAGGSDVDVLLALDEYIQKRIRAAFDAVKFCV